MRFAQFLGDKTEAICELVNYLDHSISLNGDLNTGAIEIKRKTCPLRLHTRTGTINSELKTAENIPLVYELNGEKLKTEVSIVNMDHKKGVCFLTVNINEDYQYIGCKENKLTLEPRLRKNCLWMFSFVAGIISIHIDPTTMVISKFLFENEEPGSPPVTAATYEFDYFQYFKQTGRKPSIAPGGVSLDFDKEVGCLFAVSIGDGICPIEEKPAETLVSKPFLTGNNDGLAFKQSLQEWFEIPDDRLYVIRGAEAALCGAIKHVIWKTPRTERLLPIISISASMDLESSCGFVLMDQDMKFTDITSEISKWKSLDTVIKVNGDIHVPTNHDNLIDSLGKKGLNEIIEYAKTHKFKYHPYVKLIAARWYTFLTEQLIPKFKPTCLVFSGSFFQVLWIHFVKSIFVQSQLSQMQCNLAKQPFRSGYIGGLNKDVYDLPIIWKGSDLSVNLGAAIACLRNIAQQG